MNAKILVCLAVVSASAAAQAAEIDLSTMSDPSGTYNVAFCARPSPDAAGLPGHMFVSFSHEAHGSSERDFLAVGHTVSAGVGPAQAAWSYFGGPVSGLLKEENYSAIKQQCLDVQVNKVDYDAARALATPALQQMGVTAPGGTVFQAYKLGDEDCISFATTVAKILEPRGLKVPKRNGTELPMDYMERFIEAN